MKKFLLLGACVASIAVSSSAFAAVNYGEETGLTISVNEAENAVSVTEGLPTEGQATVLVVKGNNPATITQGDILFIDQDAAGTATFAKDMGLLLKAEDGSALEKLPAGTYTVKVGGDKVAAIAVKTFTVSDSATQDKKTVAYGNVNGDVDDAGNQRITIADASLVLQYTANMITEFKDQENNVMPVNVANVNGDLDDNGNQRITIADSSLILQYTAGMIDGFKDQSNNPLTTLEYSIEK